MGNKNKPLITNAKRTKEAPAVSTQLVNLKQCKSVQNEAQQSKANQCDVK